MIIIFGRASVCSKLGPNSHIGGDNTGQKAREAVIDT